MRVAATGFVVDSLVADAGALTAATFAVPDLAGGATISLAEVDGRRRFGFPEARLARAGLDGAPSA